MFLGISSQNGNLFGFHQNGRLELVTTVLVIFFKSLYSFLKGDYQWAELAGETCPIVRRIPLLIRTISLFLNDIHGCDGF